MILDPTLADVPLEDILKELIEQYEDAGSDDCSGTFYWD